MNQLNNKTQPQQQLPLDNTASQQGNSEKIRATIAITNVVVTVVLGCAINLRLLSLLPNTKGRYIQFPALDIRFKGTKKSSTVLVFRTGCVTLPGSRSVEEALLKTHTMRLMLEQFVTDRYRQLGWPRCGRKSMEEGRVFDFHNYRVVNIVFTIHLNHGISLESFVERARGRALYEPDLFSCAKFKPRNTFLGCKMNLFDRGRITLMGGKTVSHTIEAAHEVMKYIVGITREDVQANPNARYSSRMARFHESDLTSSARLPLPITVPTAVSPQSDTSATKVDLDEDTTGYNDLNDLSCPTDLEPDDSGECKPKPKRGRPTKETDVIATLAEEYGMSVDFFKQTYGNELAITE